MNLNEASLRQHRKAWADMSRRGPLHDDHLFYRYARRKGYKVTREPLQCSAA